VVRDAGHREALTLAQLSGGEGDAEDGSGPLRIFTEGLIEITQAKENNRVGMGLFYSLVLVENWNRSQFCSCPRSCQAVTAPI
jgi:hypothetical protein